MVYKFCAFDTVRMRRFSGQSLPEPMRHRSESPLAAKQHSAPRKQGEQELSEAFRADCLTSCEDPSCQAFGVLFGVSQVRQIERKKEMTADPSTAVNCHGDRRSHGPGPVHRK